MFILYILEAVSTFSGLIPFQAYLLHLIISGKVCRQRAKNKSSFQFTQNHYLSSLLGIIKQDTVTIFLNLSIKNINGIRNTAFCKLHARPVTSKIKLSHLCTKISLKSCSQENWYSVYNTKLWNHVCVMMANTITLNLHCQHLKSNEKNTVSKLKMIQITMKLHSSQYQREIVLNIFDTAGHIQASIPSRFWNSNKLSKT